MLVLSRKLGEQVRIGNDIVVTVVKLSGNRVRLGINGPKQVPIRRGELAESCPDNHSANSFFDVIASNDGFVSSAPPLVAQPATLIQFNS